MLKIYGKVDSRTFRPLWAAEESGVECELVPVNLQAGEHKTPEFLKLNPGGKVPVLVDGDRVLTESVAICEYIAERDPKARLLPLPGTWDRHRCNQWIFFAVTEVEPPLWNLYRHTVLLPANQRFSGMRELAAMEFARHCETADKALRHSPFLLGNDFSLADLVLGHSFFWALKMDLVPESARLREYIDQLKQRPAVKSAIKKAT